MAVKEAPLYPGREADAAAGVTAEIAAEAAVWVARLHGPSRSPAMEQEFRAWQARSGAHRDAFDWCTETWLDAPGLSMADAVVAARRASPARPLPGVRRRWAPVLALITVAAGGALLFQPWSRVVEYRTGIGEQQRVVLADDSRVTLNTDTQLRVSIGRSERRIDLEHGEALFEVAKDSARPFVVRADGSSIVAHGTSFAVRLARGSRGEEALTVTLVEGRISVNVEEPSPNRAVQPVPPRQLTPGERVRFVQPAARSPAALVQVDRPNLERALAWQRSEVALDKAALSDAINEMNRYSRTIIVLSGPPELADLRVTGLYRAGNSEGFARAVAALHGLTLRERSGRLELSKPQ